MGVQFSHFEARVGCKAVRGDHASTLRRLYGTVKRILVAVPDPEQPGRRRRPPLFARPAA